MGVATLPSLFLASGTWVFYSINRPPVPNIWAQTLIFYLFAHKKYLQFTLKSRIRTLAKLLKFPVLVQLKTHKAFTMLPILGTDLWPQQNTK